MVVVHKKLEDSFGFEKNSKIWADIGVNSFGRNCLLDEKTKHEICFARNGAIGVDADSLSKKLLQIENQNKRATELLQLNGYIRSARNSLQNLTCVRLILVLMPHTYVKDKIY